MIGWGPAKWRRMREVCLGGTAQALNERLAQRPICSRRFPGDQWLFAVARIHQGLLHLRRGAGAGAGCVTRRLGRRQLHGENQTAWEDETFGPGSRRLQAQQGSPQAFANRP